MANLIESKISLQSININDVQIPASVIQSAKIYLLTNNITKDRLNEYITNSFHPVQKFAYDYLNKLQDCVSMIQKIMIARLQVEKASLRVKEGKSGYQYIYNRKKFKSLGRQLHQKTIDIVVATQQFSVQMQQALGKTPILAYTHLTKSNPTDIYIIEDIGKITKTESKTKGIYNPRLRANLKTLQEYAQKIDRLQYMSETQLKYLQTAYKEILHRFDTYVYQHKPSHLILWDMGKTNKWSAMWLQQRGDIVESYQRAVFTRYEVFNGSTNQIPEQDIQKFMELLLSVDSVSGLLQGDTEIENLSVSSKMLGSQPQGITEAIKTAAELINLTDNSQQNVISYLENRASQLKEQGESGTRNAIIEIAKNQLEGLAKKS